ncbi:hypothetical protein M3Y97_00552100 [Aphelenchoides bicaudatus]|nr:hypothetical protein M3Y97_00552100 [Aphelenchoides bicaudatus]
MVSCHQWKYSSNRRVDEEIQGYRNCSATLESGDFYLVIRKVREVYGVESIQNRYARKTLESLWSGLCKTVGIGRESIISLDEWVQLLRKVNKNEKEPKWLDDYQAFMFKLFDVSGDGVLDQSEYADGMSLYGFKYKECMNNFKQIAFDSNGKEVKHITPAIWKTLFTDLFFSADKNRPGNLLFGKGIYSKGNPVPDKSLEKTNSMDKSNSTDKTQMVKSNSQE